MARRAKDQDLPTMDRPEFKELDEAITDYQEKKKDWMDKGEQVGEAKEKVIGLMKDHGLTKYRYDDLLAEVSQSKDELKVKPVKQAKG